MYAASTPYDLVQETWVHLNRDAEGRVDAFACGSFVNGHVLSVCYCCYIGLICDLQLYYINNWRLLIMIYAKSADSSPVPLTIDCADFIVEQSTTDIWRWRKWNSGRVEL